VKCDVDVETAEKNESVQRVDETTKLQTLRIDSGHKGRQKMEDESRGLILRDTAAEIQPNKLKAERGRGESNPSPRQKERIAKRLFPYTR
jgi:hypothetical protein